MDPMNPLTGRYCNIWGRPVILIMHTLNNPVMRTAVWMMDEDSRRRTLYEKQPDHAEGLVSKRKRMIGNRWWLYWVMYKNPSIVKYRKDFRQEDKEKKGKESDGSKPQEPLEPAEGQNAPAVSRL